MTSKTGSKNCSGKNIARIRKSKVPRLTQEALAVKLQLNGLDISRKTLQKIESGNRCVYHTEIKIIADTLNVSVSELLED